MLNTHFTVLDVVDVDDAFITLDAIVNGDVVDVDVVAVDENRRSKLAFS